MEKKELKILISKYLEGNADSNDVKMLDEFFDSYKNDDQWKKYISENEEELKSGIYQNIQNNIESQYHKRSKKSLISFKSALVSVLAVVVLTTAILIWNFSIADNYNSKKWITKEVPYGQKDSLKLSDGSQVFLNSGSSISYPEEFGDGMRVAKLAGEAYFDIAHDAGRPFEIESGNVMTHVLGTSFNIRAFADEPIEVTVKTGRVRVFNQDNQVQLTPGRQARYLNVSNRITTKAVNVKNILSWQKSILSFQNVALKEALTIIERQYNVEFALRNKILTQCEITGKFNNNNLAQILKSLNFIIGVDYTFDGKRNIVLSNGSC
jgi:ferric-dicitrate binding protein FerR (iron transport regulator)